MDLILTAEGYAFDLVGSLTEPFGAPNDFDKNHEGHSGYTSSQILALVYDYLTYNPPDIVLLHIGTNDITVDEQNAANVAAILDAIEDFENINGTLIWVILARIINRNCITFDSPCIEGDETTQFNDDVENMAQDRIDSGDKIFLIDMENGANFDYRLAPLGDMNDNLHPSATGYEKMADLWFSAIQQVTLPVADAGSDQSVFEGDTVTLNATGSSDPNSSTLNYQWAQTGGTPVDLSDPQTARPFFTAPDVAINSEILTFMLTVENEENLISTDTVSIVVGNIIQMIEVTSPNGGEQLSAGETFEITWAHEGLVENVKIEYSVNNGESWLEIVSSTENDGSFEWEVPLNPSDECLAKISGIDGAPSDESDAVFSLTPPICKSDYNGDGYVNHTDLAMFSSAMGEMDCTWRSNLCDYDSDGDGDVDGADLASFTAEFGRTDCP